MMLGMVVGVVRMLMDFILPQPACGEPDGRPFLLMKVHYLYFAMILMGVTIVVTVMVSLVTPPIDDKCVSCGVFRYMQLLQGIIENVFSCSAQSWFSAAQ